MAADYYGLGDCSEPILEIPDSTAIRTEQIEGTSNAPTPTYIFVASFRRLGVRKHVDCSLVAAVAGAVMPGNSATSRPFIPYPPGAGGIRLPPHCRRARELREEEVSLFPEKSIAVEPKQAAAPAVEAPGKAEATEAPAGRATDARRLLPSHSASAVEEPLPGESGPNLNVGASRRGKRPRSSPLRPRLHSNPPHNLARSAAAATAGPTPKFTLLPEWLRHLPETLASIPESLSDPPPATEPKPQPAPVPQPKSAAEPCPAAAANCKAPAENRAESRRLVARSRKR